MSRPLSEILNDSVELLNRFASGETSPGDGDVYRNIQFIRNVLDSEDGKNLPDDVKSACESAIRGAEHLS